jgi:hypothetical protein
MPAQVDALNFMSTSTIMIFNCCHPRKTEILCRHVGPTSPLARPVGGAGQIFD